MEKIIAVQVSALLYKVIKFASLADEQVICTFFTCFED